MGADDFPAIPETLSEIERLRLLSLEVELRTNSRDLVKRLSPLISRAEQAMPVTRRITMEVAWTGSEFRLGGGEIEGFELSVTSVIETIFQVSHHRAIAMLPDHFGIRAALGMNREHSFLIVGAAGTGKSTLALRLVLEGLEMAGDELAMLYQGSAVAFPRKFLLHEDSLALLPRSAILDQFAPENPQVDRLLAIDPIDFGKPWRIVPAPVSAIFHLEANHGGQSLRRPSGKVEMVQRLLPNCSPPVSGRKDWVGDLCNIVEQADNHVLEVGDLDSAVSEIRAALD